MEKTPEQQPQPQAAPGTEKVLTDAQAIAQYNDIKQKYSLFFQKALDIEQELVEHNLVATALGNLKSNRKCFRKIGGVLVEKDSDTVKKDLDVEIANIKQTLDIVYKSMKQQEELMQSFQKKYAHLIGATKGKETEEKKTEEKKPTEGVLV